MSCSCLFNSITPSGNKVGMAWRLARALNFTSTSSSATCQLERPGVQISLQLKLPFFSMKKCLLQANNPLDDTLMSLLQGIKVSMQHDRVGRCKVNLLDTHSHFSPRIHRMLAQRHGLREREVTPSQCQCTCWCQANISLLSSRVLQATFASDILSSSSTYTSKSNSSSARYESNKSNGLIIQARAAKRQSNMLNVYWQGKRDPNVKERPSNKSISMQKAR